MKLNPAQSSALPFPINNLTRETRLLIWEAALFQESSERIVLLGASQFDIIPSKSLISPMLVVSKESRACALDFFNLKLSLFDIPTSLSYCLELNYLDIGEMIESPRDDKCVYISLEHDTFTAGLDFQPMDNDTLGMEDDKWGMVPVTFVSESSRIMDTPIINIHRNEGAFHMPARYRSSTIWGVRSRIQNVIAPCADGFHYRHDCPAACPCQKRRYPEAFADLFWSDQAFPGIKRYFMYPWGPNTKSRNAQLLRYLFKRQPGESLPAKYKPRELVWGEQPESFFGDAPHEIQRYKMLMDPNIDEFHLCSCL
ncbi:hypothetical protein F4805DRAFT_470326 [Annulohypoxylon moriforme]|nr:hypothetical protein F4805DRAFT_470326 [Annulohypoxylon moriforme]